MLLSLRAVVPDEGEAISILSLHGLFSGGNVQNQPEAIPVLSMPGFVTGYIFMDLMACRMASRWDL
jgi:hypothetical protein